MTNDIRQNIKLLPFLGKSAHGAADTDMAGLLGQLQVTLPKNLHLNQKKYNLLLNQREADDLCGHRGLAAGSDHQTFAMSLPHKLRAYYDKVTVIFCIIFYLYGSS